MGSQRLFRSRPAASLRRSLMMSLSPFGQVFLDGVAVGQFDAADRPAFAQHEDGVMAVVPFARLGIPILITVEVDEGGASGKRSASSVYGGVSRSDAGSTAGEFLFQALLAVGEVLAGAACRSASPAERAPG